MSVKVEQIAMEGFFKHKKSLVKLPDKGIVLVTGPNGAGKSSIAEAVSVALWGKTLRGTSPWPGAGRVRVLATGHAPVAAERLHRTKDSAHSHDRTTLSWGRGPGGGEEQSYETTTKAQQALETVVGPWDVWRRSAVFSSQDASHFTLATDKERKLLLETILGLGCFDPALEACRGDLKQAAKAVETAKYEEEGLKRQLEDRKDALERFRRVAEMEVVTDKPIEPAPFDEASRVEELTELDSMIQAGEAELKKLLGTRDRVLKEEANAHASYVNAKHALERLSASNCPTCGQAIPAGVRGPLEEIANTTKHNHEAAARLAHEAEQHYQDDKEDIEDEIATLRTKRQAKADALTAAREQHAAAQRAYAITLRTYKAAVRHVEELQAEIARAAAEVTQTADAQVTATEARRMAEHEHALLSVVEQVLGLKGVRAHILGQALAGIEAVGNAWLSRFCGDALLSLELKPYSEKATGGVTDAISIEVNGAGGGFGYRASSGGERRRIDVALLLALGEVAQAANGAAQDATLWFDEVFDALDTDGAEVVASALRDLARTRTVVVMTHSEALALRIDATVRLHVEDGQLDVAGRVV